MNYKIVIYWLLALTSVSCTTNRSLSEKVKGNWLNATDSIEWIITLQPEFAVYKNQFWEYKKVSGTNRRINISLKNHEGSEEVQVKAIGKNLLWLKAEWL